MLTSSASKLWRVMKNNRRGFQSKPLPEVFLDDDGHSLGEKPLTEEKWADCLQPFVELNRPVILRNYHVNCAAVQKWCDLDYLLQYVGANLLCEVEIGQYTRGQRVSISFEDYITYIRLWMERYELTEPDHQNLLYLAQNDIPHGISDDVPIPPFCQTATPFSMGRLYNRMLWMGPKGCASPLHFDPLHNFYMQIVGRKQVLLVSSDTDGQLLYTGSKCGMQPNTSAADLADDDCFNKFPLLKQVPEIEAGTLGPGDALFIPSRWWHHMNSIDFSISVNCWWR